jgi:hypothetical protein
MEPERLTLYEMMFNYEPYRHLPDDLIKLPVPLRLKIGRRRVAVPQDLDAFTNNLCYGQRLFFTQKEDNDFGVIIRVIDGYFYPLLTGKTWDVDNALRFGKKVLSCRISELYPVAMHLITLVDQMAERETRLLHRDPSKLELAAGIEKLNVFAELSSLDFLRDAMKITVPEVLLTPYKECLVRFMMQKEVDDYKERYLKLAQEEAKSKLGTHGGS